MNYNLKDYLFLFDIDGTILDSGGSGKSAFSKTFEIILNKKIDIEINFLGGIDNMIFKNLYVHYRLPTESLKDNWKIFKEAYLKLLARYSKERIWNLFPEVDKAIKILYYDSNIGLVTGNIEKGAFIKLKKFGLDKYFNIGGGYGDIIESRNKLVETAINNCEKKIKKKFDRKKIILFGDTEIDVESAHQNGIIPVLIDHKNKYSENFRHLSVSYYGDFRFIETFFKNLCH